jgi:hypothetical protein
VSAAIPFKLTVAGQDAAFNLGAIDLNVTHVQLGSGNHSANGNEIALVTPQEAVAISGHFEVSVGQHRIAAVVPGSGSAYQVSEIGLWSGVPGAGGSVLVFYWSMASGYIALKSASIDFNFESDLLFGGVVPGNITIVADTEFNALAMLAAHEAQSDPHSGYLLESDVVSQADAEAGIATVAKAWTAQRVRQAVTAVTSAIIDAAPAVLDTLNELAAALGDDANFATTITNALALKAPKTEVQSGAYLTATAGGSADAITAVFTPAITILTDGMTLSVRASSANTVAGVTFTPNNGVIAAGSVVKGANVALVAGDISGADHELLLKRNNTLGKWVLLNPATGIASGVLPLSALDYPTITTASNTLSVTGNIVVGQGGTVSIPADIQLSVGREIVEGSTGVMSAFSTAAWTSGNMFSLSTYYLRAQVQSGVLTFYLQQGADSDVIPSSLKGTPGAASGGGFDSTQLDILVAKIVTGSTGTTPTVTGLANRYALSYSGEQNIPTDTLATGAADVTFTYQLNWARAPKSLFSYGASYVGLAQQALDRIYDYDAVSSRYIAEHKLNIDLTNDSIMSGIMFSRVLSVA